MKRLKEKLRTIDGKSYKAYKDIQGTYSFQGYRLAMDYAQGDPFASPSKIRVIVPAETKQVDAAWLETKARKKAVEDRLARIVGEAVRESSVSIKGSGKSGNIFFDAPHQQIIERSALQIAPKEITICFSVGLPANGRRINGKEADKLFFQALPGIIEKSIRQMKDSLLQKAVELADQQMAIRQEMERNDWIAFIANGSVLPRLSGISDKPLKDPIAFQSPPENEVTISIPYSNKPLKGMAIKKGITLIVGGGYHGKSTILEAIEKGVYEHVDGDGREYVLTDPDAMKIRAEDGRRISNVNISPFITNLPQQKDTTGFTTENASGSTSQAANVVEAMESGVATLLIDEDTSATNFMIRDKRMQQLVTDDKEPITPFIHRVRQLHDEKGISTILVMGGSGDYFSVADNVIMMDEYVPYNVTQKAKAISGDSEIVKGLPPIETAKRRFSNESLQIFRGKKPKVQAKGLHHILMGRTDIDFSQTEQLVDVSQTRMIAEVLRYLKENNQLDTGPIGEVLEAVEEQFDKKGLASFTKARDQHPGDLARPRKHEILAVLNRIRTARVSHV